MSLTNQVIGPIKPVDWILLKELFHSIKWMKSNIHKHQAYEYAIRKEQQVYQKTLQKYA